MARGGARAGAGRPSKLTGDAAKIAGQVQVRVIRRVGIPALEALHLKMDYWLRRYHSEEKKGDAAKHEIMAEALDKVEESANKIVPYTSRRLASIELTPMPYDLSKLTEAELAQFERLARTASLSDGDRSGEETTRH